MTLFHPWKAKRRREAARIRRDHASWVNACLNRAAAASDRRDMYAKAFNDPLRHVGPSPEDNYYRE